METSIRADSLAWQYIAENMRVKTTLEEAFKKQTLLLVIWENWHDGVLV